MLFNSYAFIFLFLPIAILLFFTAQKFSRHLQIITLILLSLFFYAWWNAIYLFLLIFSVGCNYCIGLKMQVNNDLATRRLLLVVGIIFNLSLLGYFKYANFFVDNLSNLLVLNIKIPRIILPLAISFFTFQQVAYLVDVNRGFIKKTDFFSYCLFITFFPQLIAGPIVHHNEIVPQLQRSYVCRFNFKNISIGITFFCLGLFKKLALADNIAPFANAVFESGPIELTFFEAWAGALAYTFQLYFDFSGYSDMAIGLAKMFNINLPTNFNSPYKSKNIIEFWRRWHLTLSRFLRDYLYIPLGGNRKGGFRRHINLFATMMLGGLWHGANWTFVLWGFMHGFYLFINHLWRKIFPHKETVGGYNICSRFITFILIVFAWVPFRSHDISTAWKMIKTMLNFPGLILPGFLESSLGFLQPYGIHFGSMFTNDLAHWFYFCLWFGICAFIAFFMPNTQEIMRFGKEAKLRKPNIILWKPTGSWALATSILIFLSIFLMSAESEFLYFQF